MENLELLIGKTAAKKIFDNNVNVLQCSEDSIQYLIGKKAAAKITAAKQLFVAKEEIETIKRSNDIANMFRELKFLEVEQMHVLCLNRANKVISKFMLSSGGRYETNCDTANLFKRILLSNASGFAIIHNHPSGSLKPSQNDITLTEKVNTGSKILDLKMLDHVIIANDDYFSFLDNGYL
jgi:DNA repair protein RadC